MISKLYETHVAWCVFGVCLSGVVSTAQGAAGEDGGGDASTQHHHTHGHLQDRDGHHDMEVVDFLVEKDAGVYQEDSGAESRDDGHHQRCHHQALVH